MITAVPQTDGTVNLVGKQGTTWVFYIDIWSDDAKTEAYPLTGFSARGVYKASTQPSSTDLIVFTCTVADSKVTVSATAAQSSAVSILKGVYDIELYNADESIVERIMEGKLTMSQGVTTS